MQSIERCYDGLAEFRTGLTVLPEILGSCMASDTPYDPYNTVPPVFFAKFLVMITCILYSWQCTTNFQKFPKNLFGAACSKCTYLSRSRSRFLYTSQCKCRQILSNHRNPYTLHRFDMAITSCKSAQPRVERIFSNVAI